MEQQQRTPRLCSEIQLFDLCELDACPHKDGRYCTEAGILDRFEAIKEEDERNQYLPDEFSEDDETDDYDADDYDGEDDDEI